ncbi:MAG TPA: AI-2E family transporter [Ilumatobacter sp.]|nr:AI-2E family transporter [Ilumatobacter sp.]
MNVASPVPSSERPGEGEARVHPRVALAAAYAWRLVAIGLFVAVALWFAGQLLLVLVPLAVAALLTRALAPVYARVRQRTPPALAAAATVLAFVIVLAGSLGAVGWAVAGELDDLPATLDRGIDDVIDWLVEDSPFDVTRAEAEQWRSEAGDALAGFVRSVGGDPARSGAVLVGELVVGVVLALIVTFFLLKDGRRFVQRATLLLPAGQRPVTNRMLDRAWEALGGYLRGAALLGLVEALLIGLAMLIVGAELIPAVMLITFLAAFVPLVGAVVAGVIAVLVTLVTAGTIPALIIALVAVVVQQVDNDVLAPVIYGRTVRLHPLVVLLGIAAGGALFGFVGTVFAVPVLAVVINAADERRADYGGG